MATTVSAASTKLSGELSHRPGLLLAMRPHREAQPFQGRLVNFSWNNSIWLYADLPKQSQAPRRCGSQEQRRSRHYAAPAYLYRKVMRPLVRS